MTPIYIRNASTLVTDDQVAMMTRACAYQARYHLAPDWDRIPTQVTFQPAAKTSPVTTAWVITVYDDADQADDLGWHTEENGIVYGKVFARPSLDAGSSVFSGPYAISSVLSHEVLETVLDPFVSSWVVSGTDRTGGPVAHALEACDAVEDGTYSIRDIRTAVTVSNYILPAWTDPEAHRGPFDRLSRLTAPFTTTPGGYQVVWANGVQAQKFGERMPAWRQDQKRHPLGRGARRTGIAHPSALHAPPPDAKQSSWWDYFTGRAGR
jgi:hypothetical protein